MNRALNCYSALGLLALLAAGALTACAGEPANEQEETAKTNEALGEPGCESAPKDVAFASASAPADPVWTASMTADYGSPSCPGQFLVGYGADAGMALVDWADAPITSFTECVYSHLTLGGYVETNGVWEIKTTKLTGWWSNGVCSFDYDAGYGPVNLNVVGNKHRLAAAAYTYGLQCIGNLCYNTNVPKKVRVALTIVGPH